MSQSPLVTRETGAPPPTHTPLIPMATLSPTITGTGWDPQYVCQWVFGCSFGNVVHYNGSLQGYFVSIDTHMQLD